MPTRPMPKGYQFVLESPLVKWKSRLDTLLYRASGGKLAGTMQGAPVLLLTTRGRKSGQPRVTPLIFLEDGEQLAIVASKGGAAEHPLWYRNLQASPEVEVEQGSRRRRMIASTVDATERARLWPRLVGIYAPYADYQSWTDREIPVVVLRDRV
jgi:deazaflavin-dependent oxidoreductase (nitroreductase family)